ncbi:MAG TPA: glutamate formimidoyltransferase [Polyangia bacterium]|jgi:glutamate formiminotransferase/formiminotetrahydrofolate cyclodeaminase
MAKLVECVPNFSEGRDRQKIDAITQAITQVAGVRLLDVDPGADTNRTVVTFVGAPEAVAEAAFQAVRRAAEVLDMRTHHGAHSRIGATDVCPFVPLEGVTMEECVQLARELGERVGRELGIPVYLYEEAATRPERRNLAEIRKGEYEGLRQKLADPAWKPDYGPAELNPGAGATVIGAREFLIAYNVNLNTREKRLAVRIAQEIRESGKPKKDAAGNFVLDAKGEKVFDPGRLRACKATGWFIEQYGLAQVSINLTNYKVTPVHVAFDECVKEAEKLGLRVTGSELVGLIPKQALLMAGRHYLERQGLSAGQPEADLIDAAVLSLGLAQVAPFEPKKKIIELAVLDEPKLGAMSVRGFVDVLSTASPTPGGGSVAALCGALGGALAAMVGNLTVGKKGYEVHDAEMRQAAAQAQALKAELLAAVDRDAAAYDGVMSAMRLPKKTPEEETARANAVERANKAATTVPLEVMRGAAAVAALTEGIAERGFRPSLSDAGVAAAAARTACIGAYLNVRINLGNLADRAWAEAAAAEAKALRDATVARCDAVVEKVTLAL